jgi:hypothetical protein
LWVMDCVHVDDVAVWLIMATVVQGCRGEDGWGTGSETISH